MAIEVFNRYEQKYLLDTPTFLRVKQKIDQYMEKDAYNTEDRFYTVSNIYFDTEDYSLVRTSLQKPAYKEKLRLRSYGVCAPNAKVFLEIKKKYKGLVNKRRTKIAQQNAFSFVNGGKTQNEPYMNPQVIKELSYFVQTKKLVPKAYVAYDRLAYFEKNNPDLRISFDKNVRARDYDLDLSSGDYGNQLLNRGMFIMEIKTRFSMPLWLTKLLCQENLRKTSFSKYGSFYEQTIKTPQNQNLCVNL